MTRINKRIIFHNQTYWTPQITIVRNYRKPSTSQALWLTKNLRL